MATLNFSGKAYFEEGVKPFENGDGLGVLAGVNCRYPLNNVLSGEFCLLLCIY